MDSDSWARFNATISRRNNLSRSDVYQAEEYEAEDEQRPEYLCPFCDEDFDMVGLCCHIDEDHAVEVKNGVCPVCAKKVGSDLVRHITMQHGTILQVQRRRRFRRGATNLSFSALRRDLREGNLQSLLRGSSFLVPSSHAETETDPLLTSFINNPPCTDEPPAVQSLSSTEARSNAEPSFDSLSERAGKQLKLSEEDMKERARRSEFVQGLVLSTFLDDSL